MYTADEKYIMWIKVGVLSCIRLERLRLVSLYFYKNIDMGSREI